MTLYEELGQAFKLRKQEGESFTDFAMRASARVNKCTDAQWKELSAELQTWNNSVMELTEGKSREDVPELPELDGFPEDDEPAVDEDGVVQEDASGEAEDDENTEEEADEGVDAAAEGEQDAEPPSRRRGKPNKQEKKMPTRAVTAEKEKTPTAAKAKKATVAKKVTNGSGSRTRLDPEATIKILSKENPHREGSARFKRWSKYKEGMTVAAALKAGFNAGDIQHSVADGNIKIV